MVPVIRTRWLPGNIVGLSLGIAVLIDPRYFEDEPTLRHELIHCRQFWRNGLVIHFFRYWCSKPYRLAMEVEAFREELAWIPREHYDHRLEAFATALTDSYGLKLAQNQARQLIDINATPVA